MCGIFFYKGLNTQHLREYFEKISHRGPDDHRYIEIDNNVLGFHRLSINGLDDTSGQPMKIGNSYLICNGEIYNYKELQKRFSIKLTTNSDCEIILHLYKKFGIKQTCELINGEFSFVIYDNGQVYIGRDPLGIRSLYWYKDHEHFYVASEMKAIPPEIIQVSQFPPGCYYNHYIKPYYNRNYKINYDLTENEIHTQLQGLLIECVHERLMSDRPIGCILSGGLDSTLVTAIVAQKLGGSNLRTYTIGLEGGTDLVYARKASKYLGTVHHEFIVSEEEFLNAIEETIYQIESWDTTTVRASVGNYLVAKKIKELGHDVVIFCGDVSDEIFGSYRGFQTAPNDEEFRKANEEMLKNIHFFDVLRSDKSISGASLEARVPYGDKKFVDFVMSIPPHYKAFNEDKIEKQILRKAFEGFLPHELLYRSKSAFSDAVSSKERSWFEIIQEHVENTFTPSIQYEGTYDKESLYYRTIFEKYYPGRAHTIPHYWRQPFSKNLDPSARLLEFHRED